MTTGTKPRPARPPLPRAAQAAPGMSAAGFLAAQDELRRRGCRRIEAGLLWLAVLAVALPTALILSFGALGIVLLDFFPAVLAIAALVLCITLLCKGAVLRGLLWLLAWLTVVPALSVAAFLLVSSWKSGDYETAAKAWHITVELFNALTK